MSVLTRYLLRAHVAPLLFAFVALTGVVLINTLARSLAELAGKGLPPRIFLEFFLLSLPANIALTLPMSVLVAVLFVFSRMAAENEITALRASGVDLRRMVLPLLAAAACIAGGMAWFNSQVLPTANYHWRSLMMDVAETSPLLLVRPQIINAIDAGDGGSRYFLRATEVDQAASRMRDVTIHDVSNPGVARTIYADSARMRHSSRGTDLVLVLYDGQVREVRKTDPGSFQRVLFQEQLLRIPGVRQTLSRGDESSFRTDRDMTAAMMRARIDALRAELTEVRAQVDQPLPPSAGVPEEVVVGGQRLTFAEARIGSVLFRIRELEVEMQKKYAIASATLVFVLIGVPLALRFHGGGVGMVIAASLSIFAIYYVGLIGGEALANRGLVPPWLAMWITNVFFGTLGLIGLWKIGRERSRGRGGDWSGLPEWIRSPSRRRRRVRPAEA